MASPTLFGATILADPAVTSDRTLTAPSGLSNGNPIVLFGGANSSKPTISPGWNGTAGTAWTEAFAADNSGSLGHIDSWLAADDTTNTNLWKVHTSNLRAWVWVAAGLSGADTTLANWKDQVNQSGSGSTPTLALTSLTAPAKDSLLVGLIIGPNGAADPASLPTGFTKVASGTSTGTSAGYFMVVTMPVAAGATLTNQTFTFTGSGGVWELLAILIPAGAPTANAGPDQAVSPAAAVTLDGSASFGPSGDPLTYAWTQTSGVTVTLSSSTAQKPTFTAPADVTGDTLVFSLVVTDTTTTLSSAADTVTITVAPGPFLYRRVSGAWVRKKLYRRVSGAWVWP